MSAEPTPGVHERLFVAELDSVRQALRWSAAEDPRDATHDLLSVLRVADLLSTTVVVTDAQLLDGVGLLALGPDHISAALGTDDGGLPFEVRGRADDLAECLRAMFYTGGTSLRGMEWSSIGGQDAQASWQRLAAADAEQVRTAAAEDVPAACAEALIACGVYPAAAQERRKGWEAWVGAARAGRLTVQRWEAKPLQINLADAPASLQTPEGAALAQKFAAEPPVNRSQVRQTLAATDLPEAEREVVLWWWDSAYQQALAAQHDAVLVEFAGTSLAQNANLSRRAEASQPGAAVRLSDEAVEGLGVMPGAVFAMLRYEARRPLARWWSTGQERHLTGVAFVVDRFLQDSDRSVEMVTAVLRFVLALLAGALATLADITQASTRIGLAVLAVLIAVPWQDLRMASRASRRRLAAVIDVQQP